MIRQLQLSVAMALLPAMALGGCASSTQAQSLDKYQIEELANLRCLVQTGVFGRKGVETMAQVRLENAPDEVWKKHWTGIVRAQKSGVSELDYKRLAASGPMKDCYGATITYLAANFPSEKAAKFTVVLNAEGFFDKPPRKLPETLFELCQGKYRGMC